MSHLCKEAAQKSIKSKCVLLGKISFLTIKPSIAVSSGRLGLGGQEQQRHLQDLINHSLTFSRQVTLGEGLCEGPGVQDPCPLCLTLLTIQALLTQGPGAAGSEGV